MSGQFGFAFVVISLALLAFSGIAAAYSTSPCSDGTAYGACSTKQPGFRCWGDSSIGINTLQLWLVDAQGKPVCPCSNVKGYNEVNGECVKTTCTVGGNEIQNNVCANNQKCSNGAMADDPSMCGCASGKKASLDGKTCVENRDGCRWPNSVKCRTYENCKFDANSTTDSGSCTVKNGCQYSQYNGQYWDTETQTCNQATGNIEQIPGKCSSDKNCTGGKVCNIIKHACEEKTTASGSDSGAPLLGGATTPKPASDTASGDAASKGSNMLCCLPISLGASGVGLAFMRRREED